MHVNNYDNLQFTAVSHKLTNQPNHTDIEGNIIKEGDTTPKIIPPYEEMKSVTNTKTINTDAMNENELLGTEQLYIDQPDEKRENELLNNDDELFSLANLTQLTPKRRTHPINVTETTDYPITPNNYPSNDDKHTTSNITRNEGHMTTPMVYDEQPHKDVNDETTSQSHRTLQSHRPTTNDYDEQRNEGGGDQTTNTITAKTIHKIPTHLHASFQILNYSKTNGTNTKPPWKN